MRLSRALTALAMTTAMASAASTPAHAATTYTPDGGPEVNFVGTDVSFTAVQAGQTLTCSRFDLSGEMLDPGASRPYGANSKLLGSLNSDGCTNPIAGTTTVEPTGAWNVAVTGDPTGTVWPGQMTNVAVFVETAGCEFNVEGTVDGTFDTASQVLTPTDSGLIIADTPSGFLCPIVGLAQGQDVEVDGFWTNTPPAGSSPVALSNDTVADFTPDGGPATNLVGSEVSLTSVQGGQTVACSQLDLAGSITDPGSSRLYGTSAGVIDDLISSGCTNPIAGDMTIDPTGVWDVAVTGGPSGTQWPVQLTDVSMFVASAGCEFNVAGSLDGTFDAVTQVLTPADSGLAIADTPTGFLCSILGVAQGQDIDVGGSWINTPPSGSAPLTLTIP